MIDGEYIKTCFKNALSSLDDKNSISETEKTGSATILSKEIPKFSTWCVHHVNVIPFEEYCLSKLGKHFVCLLNSLKWKPQIEVKKFKDIILYEKCELTLDKCPEILINISQKISKYLDTTLGSNNCTIAFGKITCLYFKNGHRQTFKNDVKKNVIMLFFCEDERNFCYVDQYDEIYKSVICKNGDAILLSKNNEIDYYHHVNEPLAKGVCITVAFEFEIEY